MFHSKQDVDRHVNNIFKNTNNESERNLKCYRIAKHYYAVNEYRTAIKYINRYLSTNSNSAAAYKLLGDCYIHLNMKSKAIHALKTSLEIDGCQRELVLKICELLSDPEVPLDTARATYWLERAESYHPKNPVVFMLKETILKRGSNEKENTTEMEKLLLAEVNAHPTDLTVRIRLLNFFMEYRRYKVAYQHALELEERQLFYNELNWYDCLCRIVEGFEKFDENNTILDLGFEFFVMKITFLERRSDLSMQEFQVDTKLCLDYSSAVFAFDQGLQTVSDVKFPESEKQFFHDFMMHMGAQLCFHLATLALKRAKKEYGIWQKAVNCSCPLLMMSCKNTTFNDDVTQSVWLDKNKHLKLAWNKAAALRISQAGHILRALSVSAESANSFLQKVYQFGGGKWRNRVYADIFYNRKHQQAYKTSYFVNNPDFAEISAQLPTEEELLPFDKISQSAYPESLHHLVWLGLVSFKSNGLLNHHFRCLIVTDLQFTVDNLFNTGPETLNQLDVDAFLYVSVLCAKSVTSNNLTGGRPTRLPINISEELCTPAQTEWWSCVYKIYKNRRTENISEIRLKLRKGTEAIRVIGQHGLHIKLIVLLAKLFQERASLTKNSDEIKALEARSYHYWSSAIPLLEKLEKNQQLRIIPNRLFDYRGKELTPNEVKSYLEDGRLFLGCRLMKLGRDDEAVEAFEMLKSPYATYYQGLIFKKLAVDISNEVVIENDGLLASESKFHYITLLKKARDAFFLTLDRLRCPSVDVEHPLNSKLHNHLEEIESELNRIGPNHTSFTNDDFDIYESDSNIPIHDSIGDSMDTSLNGRGILSTVNQSSPFSPIRNFVAKISNLKREAPPSLERLDAQMRHLFKTLNNDLQFIVEETKETKSELKEIKSFIQNEVKAVQKEFTRENKMIQNEIKDLRNYICDFICELKRSNANDLEIAGFRGDDIDQEGLLDFPDRSNYENITHLSQQFPYTNLTNYRKLPANQTSGGITYGASIMPPVSNILPTGNALMPNTFFSPTRPMNAADPILFYQNLGHYAQGGPLPFSDAQGFQHFPNTGVPKTMFTSKSPSSVSAVNGNNLPLANKIQSESAVISSANALPTLTDTSNSIPTTQPLKNLASSNVVPTQAHTFQIPMPTQAHVAKIPENLMQNVASPTRKAVTTTVSAAQITTTPMKLVQSQNGDKVTRSQNISGKNNEAHVENKDGSRSEFKPIVSLTDKTKIKSDDGEVKLLESRGKLYSMKNKRWTERGTGIIRILHNKRLGKVQIVMHTDRVSRICANHFMTPEMNIQKMNNDNKSLSWIGKDYSEGNGIYERFFMLFDNADLAKDFKHAFERGRDITKEIAKVGNCNGKGSKSNLLSLNTDVRMREPVKNNPNLWECTTCKRKYDKNVKNCFVCDPKENEKSKICGFTVSDSSILKKPVLKLDQLEKESKDKPKPNPFAQFSFKMLPVTTSQSTPVTSAQFTKEITPSIQLGTQPLINTQTTTAGTAVSSALAIKPIPTTTSAIGTNAPTTGISISTTATSAPTTGISISTTATSAPTTGISISTTATSAQTTGISISTTATSAQTTGISVSTTGTNASTIGTITSSQPDIKTITSSSLSFKTPMSDSKALFTGNISFSSISSQNVGNAFKKDESFKGFEGTGSLVFGNLKTNVGLNKNVQRESSGKANEEEEEAGEAAAAGAGDEFVPTAEFAPVVPLPDLVEIKTGEEDEIVLYEKRAKILRFDGNTKEWKEKGVGNMKILLNEKTGKVRLLMRRELVFKVCCNHFLDEKIEFKPNTKSKNVLTWYAQDYSDGDLKPELFAIRFGKVEFMQSFKKIIEEYQKKMKNGRIINSSTEKEQNDKENTSKPLSELFKAKPGSWECKVCYVKNKPESVKCVACEAPKPGTGLEMTTAQSPKKSDKKEEPKGIVLDPNLAKKFSFGIPQSNVTQPSSFKTTNAENIFGASAAKQTTETVSKFTFGIPQTNPSTTFAFSNTFDVKKQDGEKPKFVFSVSKSVNEGNEDSQAVGNSEPKAPFSLTGIKLNSKESSFGSTSNLSPGVSKQNFSSSKDLKPISADVSAEQSDHTTLEDSSDKITFEPAVPLPPKITVHTGEEDETVIYKNVGKLFRFRDGNWKERGKGDIEVLKHKTNNRVRLVMRWEHVLKICLNHYVTPDMEFIKKDERSWFWSAVDFSEEKVQAEKFAIRFKNAEIAKEFKNAIDRALKNDFPLSSDLESSPNKDLKMVSSDVKSADSSAGKEEVIRDSSGEDISIVYEKIVTPEQREIALKLKLPPNFFNYLDGKGCKGCIGCEKETPSESIKKTVSTPSTIAVTSTTTTFLGKSTGSTPSGSWGSFTFDKGDQNMNSVCNFKFGNSPSLTANNSLKGGIVTEVKNGGQAKPKMKKEGGVEITAKDEGEKGDCELKYPWEKVGGEKNKKNEEKKKKNKNEDEDEYEEDENGDGDEEIEEEDEEDDEEDDEDEDEDEDEEDVDEEEDDDDEDGDEEEEDVDEEEEESDEEDENEDENKDEDDDEDQDEEENEEEEDEDEDGDGDDENYEDEDEEYEGDDDEREIEYQSGDKSDVELADEEEKENNN